MRKNRGKIKVLYVCRLFNGLETSFRTGNWNPTGIPTIYKIIEALDCSSNFDLHVVVTSKSRRPDRNSKFINCFIMSGLDSIITVLSSFGNKYGRVGFIAQEIFHATYIVLKSILGQYDVIYIDNANIFAAAAIARMRYRPVIFRVMGVYPAMRNAMIDKNIKSYVLRKCYKSPFTTVICTQDGSGVEPWLSVAINKSTTIHTLINGVDFSLLTKSDTDDIYSKFGIPKNKLLIFFLGKMEKIKGIYEFIEGFSLANNDLNGEVHAVIVGHGDQYKAIKSKIYSDPNITLIDRVPHNDIYKFHKISDIYVSTNRLANLTNANLEAMAAGDCIVIPESQPNTSVDLITDKLLDDSAVYRIPFPPTSNNVKEAINILFANSELRSSLSSNVVKQSKQFLTSWDERINNELHIILSSVKNKTKDT